MDPRTFHTRRGVIHFAIQVVLLALCVRLAVIQVLHHPRYVVLANDMERTTVTIEPQRGHIVDRNGIGLAVTTRAPSAYANPRAIPADRLDEVSARLAAALDIERAQVDERLGRDKYFVWLKRKLSSDEVQTLDDLDLPGVGFRQEHCRRYPYDRFLCHLLGFVGVDGDGLAGLEAQYDDVLGGRVGEETLLRDGLGRRIDDASAFQKPVQHGRNVVLTIDTRIQRIAEEELSALCAEFKPDRACAVVMDPWTGDILAMAGQPDFDPTHFNRASQKAWQPMGLTDCLEPGSSFKPFIVATALAHGVVTPETIFNCHQGRYRIGSRVLHDAHPLGRLSVRDIVAFSSNIGMAQICEKLNHEELYGALLAFGFGRPTGIDFSGESAGILRPPSQWSKLSTSSLAMGQEVAVTPLQLAAGFCVFANGGWYMRPRLVLGAVDEEGRLVEDLAGPPMPRRVLHETIARRMCNDLLFNVVERGTARRAALSGYRLAGKTGTAQIARTGGAGYEPGAYTATFVGIAPADAPRFVIAVVAKRPRGRSYYGGVVAAPAVSRMVERMLGLYRIPCQANASNRPSAIAG